MTNAAKIGVLGAGVMGITAARKIRAGGFTVQIYDVFAPARDRAAAEGFAVADSIPGLSGDSALLILFLPGPREIREAVSGTGGILAHAAPGLVVADMSTSDPALTRELAASAAARGVGYLDAPVLGRPASVGNWTLPVGGSADELQRWRPVLELLAGRIVHAGSAGSGQTIKLLNQLMFGAINAMTAEMMAIAERLGVAPRLLYETLTSSQAATVSPLFKELGRRIADEDYDAPTFSIDLLVKDVSLAVAMAESNGTPALLGRTISAINQGAQREGAGKLDTAAMWQYYSKLWASDAVR